MCQPHFRVNGVELTSELIMLVAVPPQTSRTNDQMPLPGVLCNTCCLRLPLLATPKSAGADALRYSGGPTGPRDQVLSRAPDENPSYPRSQGPESSAGAGASQSLSERASAYATPGMLHNGGQNPRRRMAANHRTPKSLADGLRCAPTDAPSQNLHQALKRRTHEFAN